MAAPHSMWSLSFPTKDGTVPTVLEGRVLTTGPSRKSPNFLILKFRLKFKIWKQNNPSLNPPSPSQMTSLLLKNQGCRLPAKVRPLHFTAQHRCVCLLVKLDSLETSWILACHVPLSKGFPRQEYCGGLPFPSPGDLPDHRMELASPASNALKADSLPAEPPEKASR